MQAIELAAESLANVKFVQEKKLIQRYFGPIAKGAAPPVATKPDPGDLATEKRLEIEADVELPRVTISWVTPPSFAPGDAELDLLASVLAEEGLHALGDGGSCGRGH